jgi:hypothetical protein
MWNHAVWFYAEPCGVEKHVQEDKKNKRSMGARVFGIPSPLQVIYMEVES